MYDPFDDDVASSLVVTRMPFVPLAAEPDPSRMCTQFFPITWAHRND